MQRDEVLKQVETRDEPWDVIVIGGGATGVGCALDAASRGLDVLLLEGADFGKGTSSRSTKLVHGGVRYLAQGNIPLVREALKERGILLKNAPHTTHKAAFIVPCYSLWDKYFYVAGLKIYDLLAGKYGLGKTRLLSKRETIGHLPNIKSEGLGGGVMYFDGQFDDTRLLIDMVTTAHENGAAPLNYARVNSLIKENGKIAGLVFEDVLTGRPYEVKTQVVINATGAFCDPLRIMSDALAEEMVTLSQGVHIVLDSSFVSTENALMIPKTSDGRVLFVIPWHGHTLVGTTDTPIDTAKLEPEALEEEIEFILKTAGEYLAKKPCRGDILSVFTGIRPLVKSGGSKNTAALSRGHTIEIDAAGLLTITGGKWTTYRSMAEDAVNQTMKLGGFEAVECRTAGIRIGGQRLDTDSPKLHPSFPYTEEDIIRAVRDEMAQTLEDILARRTRVLFLDARAAAEMAPEIAQIMANELGWGEERVQEEIEKFESLARRYLPIRL